ncbi:polysaccharide biosynthesis tyrosine autokinase [Geodermatophilus arenarius]|uniref:non-specific protein-tyrosine kinase n=1 Tax=Geodermatophilus arenarius TaxID=1137990 RepID=A0ABV9LJ13_9ACTN
MSLREVLTVLRASSWLLILSLLAGGLAALGVSLLQKPTYTSTTQLFVSSTDLASASEVLQGSQFSQQRVASYASLITGQQLATRVVEQLGLPMSPEQLAAEVTATPVTDTVLIDVTVTDPSPQRAQQIADSIGAQFSSLVQELETTDPDAPSPVKVTVTQRPQVPTAPTSPKPVRNVALGLVVGLALGAGGAIARARLDRSVKDVEVLSELVSAPAVATIMRDQTLDKRHVIEQGSTGRAGEDFRRLRTNLQFLSVEKPPKAVMVSSAVAAEGKTTVVVNLAQVLADAGRQVVIVDADLRRPRVADYLGLVGDAGLTDLLASTASLEDVIQAYREGISVIAAGPIPPNPVELLGMTAMADLLEKLRAQNDFVLVDTPALLPVADASAVAPLTDGVLLSIRYGKTDSAQVARAVDDLERIGARTLGAILNMVPRRIADGAAQGYRTAWPNRHRGGSEGRHHRKLD